MTAQSPAAGNAWPFSGEAPFWTADHDARSSAAIVARRIFGEQQGRGSAVPLIDSQSILWLQSRLIFLPLL
jgi:hypothetical protein